MVKDFFVSFKDNLKGKLTNPFFGTLIGVWIVHNYKFVYTIFNFRSSTGLDDRLTFIGTYLESGNFLPNLFLCIGVAFIVLVVSYLFLSTSRLIVQFFEKQVFPLMYKLTDKGTVVLKSDYEILEQENIKLVSRIDLEREAKLRVQAESESLETKIKEQLIEIKELEDSIEKNKVEDKKRQKAIEATIKETVSKSKLNFSSIPTPVKPDPFEGVDKDKIEALLENHEVIDLFNEASLDILKGRYLQDDDNYDNLLFRDLVNIKDRDSDEDVSYSFTKSGRYLRELILSQEETIM